MSEDDFRNKVGAVMNTASNYDPRVIEQKLKEVPLLNTLHKRYNVPRLLLLVGIVVSLMLFTLLSFNVKFLGVFASNFIGYAYPTYRSLLAIESPETDDDTTWLTYWVVFGSFFLLEMFAFKPASYISQTTRVYFMMKVGILAWCQFGNGAKTLYQLVVKPAAKKSQELRLQVDAYLEKIVEDNEDLVKKAYEKRRQRSDVVDNESI